MAKNLLFALMTAGFISACKTSATETWKGKYVCEVCGPQGSSTADGDGPTPCWEYDILLTPQGKDLSANIEVAGFQIYDKLEARASEVEPGVLSLIYIKTLKGGTELYKDNKLLGKLCEKENKYTLDLIAWDPAGELKKADCKKEKK